MLRYKHLLLKTLKPDIPDYLKEMDISDLQKLALQKCGVKTKSTDTDKLIAIIQAAPPLRDLAKELGIPVPSLHNYVNFDTLPRIENISKCAEYYGESISSMFSEDDDLTAQLVTAIRHLPETKKQKLLDTLNWR